MPDSTDTCPKFISWVFVMEMGVTMVTAMWPVAVTCENAHVTLAAMAANVSRSRFVFIALESSGFGTPKIG
jgi:hypothetical protein